MNSFEYAESRIETDPNLNYEKQLWMAIIVVVEPQKYLGIEQFVIWSQPTTTKKETGGNYHYLISSRSEDTLLFRNTIHFTANLWK